MEAIWRFHHENWAESWSSDVFPADENKKEVEQNLRRLRSEPWWENTRKTLINGRGGSLSTAPSRPQNLARMFSRSNL